MGNRSIITQIKGGLGNQLFCYAAGYAMAARDSRELLLDVESGFLRDGYGREYRLKHFPITAEVANGAACYGGDPKKWRHKLARNFNKILPSHFRSYVREKSLMGVEPMIQFRPGPASVYINGYWQNERYFSDFAGEIRKQLMPPEPRDRRNAELGQVMASEPSVFVHVRRIRYSPLLDAEYYNEGLEAVAKMEPGAKCYVFGDDVEWAKQSLNLPEDRTVYVDHNAGDELADMWLMTRCRHAITANSSFSWWAAWLGESGSGKIWCPAKSGFALVFPKRWCRLDNRLLFDEVS